MSKGTIQPGDRFIKVDDPRIVWIVERSVDVPHTVPHVQLIQEGDPSRRITLSESVLLDSSYHRRAEER